MAWPPSAARRRYVVRLNLAFAGYAVAVAAISGWLGFEPPGGAWVYFTSLIPPVFIGAAIFVMGRYLVEEEDEFRRMLWVRTVIGANGLTLFVATAWGFLGQYAHVWALPLYLVFPMFCLGLAIVGPIVRLAYR
ncbi:MAG: hypothetical protein WAW96_00660 [Alphaproteobacteria bacterium]